LLRPVLLDGKLYSAGSQGKVTAIDADSGQVIWQVDLKQPLAAGVGGQADQLLVSTNKGQLIALSATDGHELWRTSLHSEVLAVPQSNGQLVVVKTIDGKLHGLDAHDGKQRWLYSSNQPPLILRGSSPPVVLANDTIAGFANGQLVALNNQQGNALWSATVATPEGRSDLERLVDITSAPLVSNGRVFAVAYQGQLVEVDITNGQLLWQRPASSYVNLAEGMNNIYVSQSDGKLTAFDQNTGTSVWQQSQLTYRVLSAPVVIGHYLAVGDAEGYVHFLSQVDGHFVARLDIGGDGVSIPPVVSDDNIYILANNGRLSAYRIS
jgi:outer membrane protein assembly factor BamB